MKTEKKSAAQKSLLQKKAALKKLYSAILVLGANNATHEFDSLIRESGVHFRKYGIDALATESSNKVVNLKDYKNRKESL